MGVDYYACDECGEIYDDCGGLYNNCEGCGTRICYSCQVDLGMRTKVAYFTPNNWFKGEKAEPLGDYWEDDSWTDQNGLEHTHYMLISCPHCRNEIINDDKVLSYLLKKYDLNKEDVIAEIKRQ